MKKILSIFAVLIGTFFSTLVSAQTYVNTLRSFSQTCWFCTPFEVMFNLMNNLVATTSGTDGSVSNGDGMIITRYGGGMKDDFFTLLAISFAFWLVFRIGKMAFDVTGSVDGGLVPDVLKKMLRVLVASLMLVFPIEVFHNIINPMLEMGIGISNNLFLSQMSSGTITANRARPGAPGYVNERSLCPTTPWNESNNVAFPETTKNAFLCYIKVGEAAMKNGMAIGSTAITAWAGFHLKEMFTHSGVLFLGICTLGVYFMLLVMFPLKLVDPLLNLLFVATLYPLWVVLSAFKGTSKYSSTALNLFLSVIVNLMVISVVSTICIAMMNQALGTSTEQTNLFNMLRRGQEVDAFLQMGMAGRQILMTLALGILSYTMFGKTAAIAGKFEGGIDFGGSQAATSLVGSAGSLAGQGAASGVSAAWHGLGWGASALGNAFRSTGNEQKGAEPTPASAGTPSASPRHFDEGNKSPDSGTNPQPNPSPDSGPSPSPETETTSSPSPSGHAAPSGEFTSGNQDDTQTASPTVSRIPLSAAMSPDNLPAGTTPALGLNPRLGGSPRNSTGARTGTLSNNTGAQPGARRSLSGTASGRPSRNPLPGTPVGKNARRGNAVASYYQKPGKEEEYRPANSKTGEKALLRKLDKNGNVEFAYVPEKDGKSASMRSNGKDYNIAQDGTISIGSGSDKGKSYKYHSNTDSFRDVATNQEVDDMKNAELKGILNKKAAADKNIQEYEYDLHNNRNSLRTNFYAGTTTGQNKKVSRVELPGSQTTGQPAKKALNMDAIRAKLQARVQDNFEGAKRSDAWARQHLSELSGSTPSNQAHILSGHRQAETVQVRAEREASSNSSTTNNTSSTTTTQQNTPSATPEMPRHANTSSGGGAQPETSTLSTGNTQRTEMPNSSPKSNPDLKQAQEKFDELNSKIAGLKSGLGDLANRLNSNTPNASPSTAPQNNDDAVASLREQMSTVNKQMEKTHENTEDRFKKTDERFKNLTDQLNGNKGKNKRPK